MFGHTEAYGFVQLAVTMLIQLNAFQAFVERCRRFLDGVGMRGENHFVGIVFQPQKRELFHANTLPQEFSLAMVALRVAKGVSNVGFPLGDREKPWLRRRISARDRLIVS